MSVPFTGLNSLSGLKFGDLATDPDAIQAGQILITMVVQYLEDDG